MGDLGNSDRFELNEELNRYIKTLQNMHTLTECDARRDAARQGKAKRAANKMHERRTRLSLCEMTHQHFFLYIFFGHHIISEINFTSMD